jgi:hypothetical protein
VPAGIWAVTSVTRAVPVAAGDPRRARVTNWVRKSERENEIRYNLVWSAKRRRYCFGNTRSDHAFGSMTDWTSSIAQRPRKLIAQPETITSIGMRDRAHLGQPL